MVSEKKVIRLTSQGYWLLRVIYDNPGISLDNLCRAMLDKNSEMTVEKILEYIDYLVSRDVVIRNS
mgnify:CR=1 FL=1